MKRPDLTAEKFVANPFSSNGHLRLYKTGDRARWRHDGLVEFNGRLDGQVKVNGLRIETGAIELALRAMPEVRDAAVIAHKDPADGRTRLVAYFVPSVDDVHLTNRLRFALARRGAVPRYMIPSAFVPLPALPLTPSGKLDRQALPKPEPGLLVQNKFVPPSTPLEERLCAIWAAVLGVERVGINDDFFALGGDSMKSMQIILRIRKELDLEQLKVTLLYDAPNIAELAQRINFFQTKKEVRQGIPSTGPVRGVFQKFARGRITFRVDGAESTYPVDPDAKIKTKKGEFPLAKALKKLEAGAERVFTVRDDKVTAVRRPKTGERVKVVEELKNLGITHGRADLAQRFLPLVPLNAGGSHLPFFVIHGADGGVRAFSGLAAEFQALDRPVFGVQARGLRHDGAPFDRTEDLAEYYCNAIRATQPQGRLSDRRLVLRRHHRDGGGPATGAGQ